MLIINVPKIACFRDVIFVNIDQRISLRRKQYTNEFGGRHFSDIKDLFLINSLC